MAHAREIADGRRFEFGKNWSRFLAVIDDERVREAEVSLKDMLACDSLAGKRFLDIGSGSGLFSLAARRLGASVSSFDYDAKSVACTVELKRRYFPDDGEWEIQEGSVLDVELMRSLGEFDVVYSWGVLHHTGRMWQAMENAQIPVGRGGMYFIAIYNDQGLRSRVWRRIKRTYCSGRAGRTLVIATMFPVLAIAGFVGSIRRLQNPLEPYTNYKKKRGMSLMYDWLDWLGGYPYEVARPEAVIRYCESRGFRLRKLKRAKGLANNEYVFERG